MNKDLVLGFAFDISPCLCFGCMQLVDLLDLVTIQCLCFPFSFSCFWDTCVMLCSIKESYEQVFLLIKVVID